MFDELYALENCQFKQHDVTEKCYFSGYTVQCTLYIEERRYRKRSGRRSNKERQRDRNFEGDRHTGRQKEKVRHKHQKTEIK